MFASHDFVKKFVWISFSSLHREWDLRYSFGSFLIQLGLHIPDLSIQPARKYLFRGLIYLIDFIRPWSILCLVIMTWVELVQHNVMIYFLDNSCIIRSSMLMVLSLNRSLFSIMSRKLISLLQHIISWWIAPPVLFNPFHLSNCSLYQRLLKLKISQDDILIQGSTNRWQSG